MDSKGVVSKDRGDELPGHKLVVARETSDIKTKDLTEVVKAVKPHALIGLTGRGPAFSRVLKILLFQVIKSNQRFLLLQFFRWIFYRARQIAWNLSCLYLSSSQMDQTFVLSIF